jgi:hypothetical protein
MVCPHCLKEGLFDFWMSINVDSDPELRKKIFSDDMFTYKCPHCGYVTRVPFSFSYHDKKHHFMLFYDLIRSDDYDYEPLGIPEEAFKKNDYRIIREVYGINQLREKILILEKGLNDVAIERQKYMITHFIIPDLAKNGTEFFFHHTEEPTDEFPYGTIFFVYYDEKEEKVVKVHFAMDDYYEHCKSCDMDPRMEVRGVTCVDEGWISKQLKEEEP